MRLRRFVVVAIVVVGSLALGVVPASAATLKVTTTSLPAATLTSPYSAQLTATGGTPPYAWSLSVGSLPSGLTLNLSSGAITGTVAPGVTGKTSFTARVTDSVSATATKALSITVYNEDLNVYGAQNSYIQTPCTTGTCIGGFWKPTGNPTGAFDVATGEMSAQSWRATSWSGSAYPVGQAAMNMAVTDDHVVFVGNEPQTDHLRLPTASSMTISLFDARTITPSFATITIPTSMGASSATSVAVSRKDTAGNNSVGGADIADLRTISVSTSVSDTGQAVAFISDVPYHFWDPAAIGQYPSFGLIVHDAGGWHYDASHSLTAQQLYATASAAIDPNHAGTSYGDEACPNSDLTPSFTYIRTCQGFASLAVLPSSGNIVITEYGGIANNGGVVVLSGGSNGHSIGDMLAAYPVPAIELSSAAVRVRPRWVTGDPTGTNGNERFAVVSDAWALDSSGKETVLTRFPIQEFSFDANSVGSATVNPIQPLMAPMVPPDNPAVSPTETPGAQHALYDNWGTLWIAERNNADPFAAGSFVDLYSRSALDACDAASATTPWVVTLGCAPSYQYAAKLKGTTRLLGTVWSMYNDPLTHDILLQSTGTEFWVTPFAPGAGSPPAPNAWTEGKAIQLGANVYTDRYDITLLPRFGAFDASARLLWIPIEGLMPQSEWRVTGDPTSATDDDDTPGFDIYNNLTQGMELNPNVANQNIAELPCVDDTVNADIFFDPAYRVCVPYSLPQSFVSVNLPALLGS